MRKAIVPGTVVFAFLTAVAFAQTPKSTGASSANMSAASAADQQFIKNAAEGSLAEVEMGRLAAQHASHADVKSFGQRMISDHQKVDNELKDIAAKKHVTLAATLNTQDQKTYDGLSKLSGDAFDRAYMKDMVQDHQADIAHFKAEAASGKDADVKAFASKTLPTLEDHLKAAEAANGTVAANKTSMNKATTAKTAASKTAAATTASAK